jgi:hypothetical protein
VHVSSNLPNARVVVVAHYKTRDGTYTGATGPSGTADVSFGIGHQPKGFTVVVDVTVGGQAHCRTSFTPQ